MSVSKKELRRWFEHGEERGATHMIVMCDTFNWDYYPVYVSP